MTEAFQKYIKALQATPLDQKTEHMDRPHLQALLQVIADEKHQKLQVIHEPRRSRQGLGAPDFIIKQSGMIVGYVENKQIGENLDAILKSDQIKKYKELSNNLLITNYLEWVWIKDGLITRETLCYATDMESQRFKLNPDKVAAVQALIGQFFSTPPLKIARAKKLAEELSVRSRWLRDFMAIELVRQEKEHQEGRLYGLYSVFKRDVFHQLSLKEFADAFAQTLSYGLFLAKLNAGANVDVTLVNAKEHISVNFELIRELVDFLDELKREEYAAAKWLIEEILSIMNGLNLEAIHEDLAFTKRQGRLLKDTEEERLLFAKDPYVYFYEDFLKAYDKETRKSRGVYYTPPPVVNFIIRAVNDILKDTFGIKEGLADRKKVTVLDFATGTGTFLIEVLQQIFETTSEGTRNLVIQEHVLKNLYGFEYLIAPYTIAHLKLSQFLHDRGYKMKPSERLQIYLTNTLEPIEPQANFLLPALTREVEHAQEVKEKPILVITGNPPYSGHSKNKGEWITNLIRTYSREFPELQKPGQGKWLQDDYVKFIRFAQWKMEQVDEGIVGIITNHSFLDNPTFKGMRKSLMEAFNRIYVLDLHGNSKKKEKAPDGGEDKNVFDIEQGVAISILVKKQGLKRKIFHADFWGSRKQKYVECMESTLKSVAWQAVEPDKQFYLFVPRDNKLAEKYASFFSIPEIFAPSGDPAPGIVTTHDEFAISYTKEEAVKKVEQLLATKDEAEARRLFRLCSQSQWSYGRAKEQLADGQWKQELVEILYRPFDRRWTVFNSNVAVHRRERVMRHMLAEGNLGLMTNRQVNEDFKHTLVSDNIINDCTLSTLTKERTYLFPLYLYNFPSDKKPKTTLFEEADPFEGRERIENLRKDFRTFIDKKYGTHYSPEEILGYIYAVLHSPAYRNTYAELLKIDFPRIPFVDDRKIFEKLSALGWELVQAHLLKAIPATPKVEISRGSNLVEKPAYQEKEQRLTINKDQYFSPVPREVWEFHIGGYQVLDKYLKSRKRRTLTLDEIENLQNVVKVLAFTISQMQEIDRTWKP